MSSPNHTSLHCNSRWLLSTQSTTDDCAHCPISHIPRMQRKSTFAFPVNHCISTLARQILCKPRRFREHKMPLPPCICSPVEYIFLRSRLEDILIHSLWRCYGFANYKQRLFACVVFESRDLSERFVWLMLNSGSVRKKLLSVIGIVLVSLR